VAESEGFFDVYYDVCWFVKSWDMFQF
jgi:hypothetical protein